MTTLSGVAAAKITGNEDYVAKAQRLWARGLLAAWGVELEIEGAEHLAVNQTYIIMANHQSHVDVPILFTALPFTPGFLAKKELAKVPVLSLALRAGRHVLIDRADRSSAMRAIKEAATEIRSGKTIAIFPEGTRGDGDCIQGFKRGGFLIAKRAAVPVVPVAILGSAAVLSRRARLPKSGKVVVRVGRPISVEELRSLDADRLSARVRTAIVELSGLPASAVASAGNNSRKSRGERSQPDGQKGGEDGSGGSKSDENLN